MRVTSRHLRLLRKIPVHSSAQTRVESSLTNLAFLLGTAHAEERLAHVLAAPPRQSLRQPPEGLGPKQTLQVSAAHRLNPYALGWDQERNSGVCPVAKSAMASACGVAGA
eukprot:2011636-Rhodomonas_salina.6